MSEAHVDIAPQRPWQPMALRHVGDVGQVMNRKSGRRHDPGAGFRRKKRGHGHRD
jgi:hypothetical protein